MPLSPLMQIPLPSVALFPVIAPPEILILTGASHGNPRIAPPLPPAVLSAMVPPVIVKVVPPPYPPSRKTPAALYWVVLFLITPVPLKFTVELPTAQTPPPHVELLEEISVPLIFKTPEANTDTPPPELALLLRITPPARFASPLHTMPPPFPSVVLL